MAKGFKFPAPKGFAKGGMCKPKGAKGYAKGGPARGTNVEASDLYDNNDLKSVEAGMNVPRENKNRMRSESVQNAKSKADLKREYDDMYSFNPSRMMNSDVSGAYTKMRRTEDETGEYANGGKVTMAKAKLGRKFAKVKSAYADGGEVETEQMASKATRVKMPKGRMARAKSVPVANRAPVIAPPQAAPMAGGMGRAAAPSPLARVAQAQAPMPGAGGGMGMKMGGKAKKR